MLTNLFDRSSLPVLEQVVSFTQQRHGVLAGNIANLDTPGYMARDLSVSQFRAELKEAVERRHAADAASASPYGNASARPAHDDGPARQLAGLKKEYKSILRHDGNNGGLEEQITEIAKNQAEHNLALSLMNAQFRLLRAAITERA